jgi:hypothetical protein
MRLKENRDSWRARAIIKRDFKHDHNDLIIRFKSHKNTNKWCKGKTGIRHDVEWEKETTFLGYTYQTGRCVVCGKKIYK